MGKTYSQLNVGDKGSFEKTISESDVYMFAGVTGDFNSAHINEEKAKTTKFGGRIAHGMLVGSLISTAIGMYLPGPGTIYMSQSLSFKAPVKIGDTIKAEVEVLEKLEKGRVRLKTVCYNQRNEVVIDGEALVLAPKDNA
jgi:3-hydroxybutyryl-CoA dehydratase